MVLNGSTGHLNSHTERSNGLLNFVNGLPSHSNGLLYFANGLPSHLNRLLNFVNGLPSRSNGLLNFANSLPSHSNGSWKIANCSWIVRTIHQIYFLAYVCWGILSLGFHRYVTSFRNRTVFTCSSLTHCQNVIPCLLLLSPDLNSCQTSTMSNLHT